MGSSARQEDVLAGAMSLLYKSEVGVCLQDLDDLVPLDLMLPDELLDDFIEPDDFYDPHCTSQLAWHPGVYRAIQGGRAKLCDMWRTALHSVLAVVLPSMMMAMAVCAVLPACPMMPGSDVHEPVAQHALPQHAMPQHSGHHEAASQAAQGHCHDAAPTESSDDSEPACARCCCEQPPVTPSSAVDVPVDLGLVAALTLDAPEPVLDGVATARPETPPRPGPLIPLFTLHASLLI